MQTPWLFKTRSDKGKDKSLMKNIILWLALATFAIYISDIAKLIRFTLNVGC